jgi:hypothetical protein
MAIKTFTANSVLTAADTNTYLANSGLVYIKSQAVTGTPTSVSVTGAFSADYDNYVVQWQGGTMSVDTSINMTLTGASSTSYYTAFSYGSYAGTTVANEGTAGASTFANAGGGYSGGAVLDVTLYTPFISGQATNLHAVTRYLAKWGTMIGLIIDTSSLTGFSIGPASGTMSGGKIVVYGYRKA